MKIITFLSVIWFAIQLPAIGQELNDIQYLCADWGPAMKPSAKSGGTPEFNDAEDEVYFLKQITHLRREKLEVPDLMTGSREQNAWVWRGIFLCKMKADGSNKVEIKELWHDPNYPVDVQGQSTWMNINRKTHKIALSITYAGNQVTGLWTLNLDGTELKRIISPVVTTNYLQAVNHPSWTPDGQWIVFEEELRGMNPNQYLIAKCDPSGKNVVKLTNGPHDRQPSVSPDGKQILYVHDPKIRLGKDGRGERWVAATLWLVDLDGKHNDEIPNPDAKPNWPVKGVSGTWPIWSPDGDRILLMGTGLVDSNTGKVLWRGVPLFNGKQASWGWGHWDKSGIIGYTLWGILYTDNSIKETHLLGGSRIVTCIGDQMSCNW